MIERGLHGPEMSSVGPYIHTNSTIPPKVVFCLSVKKIIFNIEAFLSILVDLYDIQ
jgi:hypothetical protein